MTIRSKLKEEWQAAIVVRDHLTAMTLISAIANRLYPNMQMAAAREAKLLEIPEMARLEKLCREDAAACWRVLQD